MSNKNYMLDFASASDTGRVRLVNEDHLHVSSNSKGDVLMLIADGMGGHASGDYASKLCVNIISEDFNSKKEFINTFDIIMWIKKTIKHANKLVFNESEKSPAYKGMGTTVVLAILHKNKICVANVGDSRAYLIKNNLLNKISQDQSVVDYLLRSGQINEEEAKVRVDKNVITDAIGTLPSINYNFHVNKYNNEDILLCSDGLYNNLSDKEILEIASKEISVKEKVKEYINKANNNGGSDNISVIYLTRKKL